MSDIRTKLKVDAVNAVHKYAMELYPKLVEIFKPYVGQKILKVDGSLLAKFKPLVDALDLPCNGKTHVYRQHSDYVLSWEAKMTFFAPNTENPHYSDHHQSETQSVRIGELKNGVLEKIYPAPVLRTDYTVAEIEQKRQAYREAKKLADEAHSQLYPFGEYERN